MRISTNGRCSIICTVGACRGEVHMKEKDSVANNVKSPDNRKTPDKKIISEYFRGKYDAIPFPKN